MYSTEERSRIGYRYLYDSKGCSLSTGNEATVCFRISDKYTAEIYIGPKPKYGIQTVSGYSKYFIPGRSASFGTTEIKKEVESEAEHGPMFTEIVVRTESALAQSDQNNIKLLHEAEGKRDQFRNIIEFVAGVIGLRFHRQFVFERLSETALAWCGGRSHMSFGGPSLELLETMSLNGNGIDFLHAVTKRMEVLSFEEAEEYGQLLHWLLLAWAEKDEMYRFLTLFIPLECILNRYTDPENYKKEKCFIPIIEHLIKDYGGEKVKEIQAVFQKCACAFRPGLNERFIDFAVTANMAGYEADIEAFKKFNRMRNQLLHRGDTDIQQHVRIGEEENRSFADIVERYINFFFFRDNKVYQSRWRPSIVKG